MLGTANTVCILLMAGLLGSFLGVILGDAAGGAILLAMIAGFACVVHELNGLTKK